MASVANIFPDANSPTTAIFPAEAAAAGRETMTSEPVARRPTDHVGNILKRVADDTIRRLPSFEELAFQARISQKGSSSMSVPCILDSGCGGGYLLIPEKSILPFSSDAVEGVVARLAQGAPVRVDKSVEVNLEVANVCKTVVLNVLPSTMDEEITVLFGRQLIDLFDIVIEGSRLARMGQKVLYRAPKLTDRIRRVACSMDEPESFEGIVPVDAPSKPDDPDVVALPVSEDETLRIRRLLELACQEGPMPLAHCPGTVCLRPLRSEEARDTPDQEFCFELSVKTPAKPPDTSETTRLYADSMLRKLSETQLGETEALVDEYVKSRWWEPVCSPPPDAVPSNIFPVPKGEASVRLVCDVRAHNRPYPSTVSFQPLLPCLLLCLRLMSAAEDIVVGDCKAAFYKVRLAAPLLLYCGRIGYFFCSRMIFGVSYGPETLESTLGLLWRLFQKLHCAVGAIYVDDYFKTKPKENVWLRLLSLVGFDVGKKKYQSTCSSSTIGIFGVSIAYPSTSSPPVVGDSLSVADCQRLPRLSTVTELLKSDSLCRATCFRIAGLLAYDPLHMHPACKVASDLLRSVSGSLSALPWDAPITASSFDCPDDFALYDFCLQWIAKLASATDRCAHACPTTAGAVFCLRLSTDASHSGGACVIEARGHEEWTTIYQVAWLWKKTEYSYHCNRLEAIALLKGLRCLCNFVETWKSCGHSAFPAVVVQSDSKSALSWARLGAAGQSDGPESRAVSRLCVGLRDELRHLRLLLGEDKVDMLHVCGAENAADAPSRMLDPIVLKLLHKRFERRSKSKSSSVKDTVRRVDERAMSLAEQVARDSYDFDAALATFETLLTVFRAWRGGPGSVPAFDAPIAIDATTTAVPAFDAPIAIDAPTTAVPAFDAPIAIDAPTTAVPAFDAPIAIDATTTAVPAFDAPIAIDAPTTAVPAFDAPIAIDAPTTAVPAIDAPTTAVPAIDAPTTAVPAIDAPTTAVNTLLRVFVKSAQADHFTKPVFKSPPFIAEADDILVHVRYDYTGEAVRTFCIPKNSPACQRLILRSAHRRNHHRGHVHTLSLVYDQFWIENGANAALAVTRSCLTCAKKNARTVWTGITSTVERLLDLPPLTRVAIDVLHVESNLVFTCMCIDTGFLVMIPCEATSTEEMLRCLNRVCQRYCCKIKSALLDRAASFTSKKFLEATAKMGIDIHHTAPSTPYTNAVERLHRECRSILRSSKLLRNLVIDPKNSQEALDSIACVINSRPLGLYRRDGIEELLTPAKLAFGGSPIYSTKLFEFRKYFYDCYFNAFRRVFNASGPVREKLLVGAPALYRPNPDHAFELCHVVDLAPPYIRVSLPGKQGTKLVGGASLAPLKLPLLQAQLQPYDVTRIGARVAVSYFEGEYFGTIATEAGATDRLEIAWDTHGSNHWANELVDWGACRIL